MTNDTTINSLHGIVIKSPVGYIGYYVENEEVKSITGYDEWEVRERLKKIINGN